MTALLFVAFAPPVAAQGSSDFLPRTTQLRAYSHFTIVTTTPAHARAEAPSQGRLPLNVGLVTKLFQQSGELSATGYSYGEQVKGQPSEISVWISNLGTTTVQNVEIAFYLGAPQSDGQQLGSTRLIALIRPGESQLTHLQWTPSQAEQATIYVAIDPNNSIAESNETDNLFSFTVTVREPVIDLSLPYYAIQPPYDLVVDRATAVTVRVENQGETPAEHVAVQLYEGDPRTTGSPIGERVVLSEIGAYQYQLLEWPWHPKRTGLVSLYALADPDNLITELDETNNIISRSVAVRAPYIDLTIPVYALQSDETVVVDRATEVTAAVHNWGEQPATNVDVRLYAGNPATGGTQIGATQVLTQVAANASEVMQFTWQPTQVGVIDIYVVVDGSNLITETDESNNVISRTVEVRAPQLTWYVDSAVATSGNGTTPERAFKTIGEAVDDARDGDTIRALAGNYAENITLPAGIRLLGEGDTQTKLHGIDTTKPALSLEARTIISGFAIAGTANAFARSAIEVQGENVTVQHNHITESTSGISIFCRDLPCTQPSTITHNIIDANGYAGIGVAERVTVTIRNNTIVSNTVGIMVDGNAAALIENNLVVMNRMAGISVELDDGQSLSADQIHAQYNNVWSNGAEWGTNQDYDGVQAGPGSLSIDPLFRHLEHGDYRLFAGSPMINSGYPVGTDIGARPFMPALAITLKARLTPNGAYQWRVSWDLHQVTGFNLYLQESDTSHVKRLNGEGITEYNFSHLLGNKTYYVSVSAYDENGNESRPSSKISFFVPPLAHGQHEEDSSGLTWSAGWSAVADSNSSGGEHYASSTMGSQLQLTFSGESLVLYRTLSTQGGWATLWLDGQLYGYISFSFVSARAKVPIVIVGLENKVHHLVLEVAKHPYLEPNQGVVTLDSIEIPSPYTPTTAQQQAVARVNWHRTIAGLPPAVGVQSIHLGAQSHVEFVANNQGHPSLAGLGFHRQDANLPGFSGEWPSDRARYYGYTGGLGEDGHFIGDPLRSVDGWMETVYHRNLIMCYGCIEMGYGMVHDQRGNFDALNMGSRTYPLPATRLIFSYPAQNQANVPREWNGGEIPDPLPDKPKPVGYPVSIHIVQPSSALAATTATTPLPTFTFAQQALRADQWQLIKAEIRTIDHQVVPTYMLDQNTDPAQYLAPDNAFLIPSAPLQENATYYALFAGIDSQGKPFEKRWAFSTGNTLEAPTIQTRVWSALPPPTTRAEVTFFVQLSNTSPYTARQLRIVFDPPQNAQFIPGSAAATQGQVQEGEQLAVTVDSLPGNTAVELHYRVTTNSSASTPVVVRVPFTVTWHSGNLSGEQVVILNAEQFYLPLIANK